MMVELEKFHKEQAKMKGKNEHRELDLRYRFKPVKHSQIQQFQVLIWS